MVKEFGQYFEEFVKSYLEIYYDSKDNKFDLVYLEYPYQFWDKNKKGNKQRYSSDMDIIGVDFKKKEVWFVECTQTVSQRKAHLDRLKEQKDRIEETDLFKNFKDKEFEPQFYVATVWGSRDLIKELGDSGWKFLFFGEMLNGIIEKDVSNNSENSKKILNEGWIGWLIRMLIEFDIKIIEREKKAGRFFNVEWKDTNKKIYFPEQLK